MRRLLRDLAADGVGVLVSSHNMTEVAEICDRVSIIHAGATVWMGTQDDLHRSAPVPAWRVWTSDDGPGVGGGPTTFAAGGGSRPARAQERSPYASWSRTYRSLEALFAALTGAAEAGSAA